MTHKFHGRSIVAGQLSNTSGRTFRATSPLDSAELDPVFHEGDHSDVEHALRQAEEAFATYRRTPAEARANFLEKIAEEIAALGNELLERCGSRRVCRSTGSRGNARAPAGS